MNQKDRFNRFLAFFQQNMPEPTTELIYTNPYELIVAVILSAQCTDKRVNLITPNLFKKFPDFKALSKATTDEIFDVIRSCSYPNSKAGYLKDMATAVIEKFDGNLPETQEELQLLPGVGRKTANVLLSVLFNKPYLAVDTHVFRVAQRIGLTINAKTPLETEKQLISKIPPELVTKAHHWLILHGRYVCVAKSPKCDQCGITDICKYFNKKK